MFALAVGAALALVSWQAGVLDTNIFGGVSDSAVSAGGPGSLVAIGAAFVIGAAMIVLPCGYPRCSSYRRFWAPERGWRSAVC